MRITKEMLLKIAETNVQERAVKDFDLVAAYVTGSIIAEAPLLGGSADIDLVFVHNLMTEEREIVRITADIHVDIQHYPRSKFENPRGLRSDAWLGPSLFNAKPLYDPQHELDFIQASVRGMYHQPEYVLARSEPFLKAARQTWIDFHNTPQEPGIETTKEYLKALENIVNAFASLTAGPLTKRRFLQDFKDRSKMLEKPGLYFGMLGLLGANELTQQDIQSCLPTWVAAYDKVAELQSGAADVHPDRKSYYLKAIEYLLDQDDYHFAVWPLLNTWSNLAVALPSGDPLVKEWEGLCKKLNLSDEGFSARLDGLDAYLETAEEFFENWKETQGL